MASSSGDDDKNDLWSWSEKQFQNLKAEHDRFFQDLKQETQRLEKKLADDDTKEAKSPFTVFKRFVDANIGSLSSSFNVKSRCKKEMERREAEELDISYRWTGSLEHPDDIERDMRKLTEYDRAAASKSLDQLLTEAEERNLGVPQRKKDALWHDPDSQWGYLDLLGFQAEERDSVTGKILEALGTQPRWLSVDWFKRSSYSPIRLEAYSELNGSGHRWRAAFEDLLCASLDKPMHSDRDAMFQPVGSRSPFGRPQAIYHGPGLEWMLSLLYRGILPGYYPRSINGRSGSVTRYSMRADHGLSFLSPYECANWQVRGKLPGDPGVSQDMADLLKEIATRATSDRATSDSQVASALEKAGITVEQDLYDAIHARVETNEHWMLAREDVPVARIQTVPEGPGSDHVWVEGEDGRGNAFAYPATAEEVQELMIARRQISEASDRWLPTGDRELDSWDAQDLLRDALDLGDAKTATKLINTWHSKYGDVEQMLGFRLADNFKNGRIVAGEDRLRGTLAEALRQSDLPSDDALKQCAFLERLDYESLEDRHRRRELCQRVYDLVPGIPLGNFEFAAFMPISKLEDYVESLEQQLESLQLSEKSATTADKIPAEEKKEAVSAAQRPETPITLKKPDVLSALTTTHTTRLPDGTVTTKVVLKRRFADGREETTESLHTTNENIDQQQQHAQKEQPKKKGWFWT
ncbi:hypothetical protein AC578_2152 [Pseudocercospora eumusae]|uniref:Uncharacterized protein n=1 Tax=Pseudocercospora eumusae TaxID=321146 RepID=A0A139HHC6_9PEZI|nr:hypothetical protein AC578_2152 [Pseudocercospora eumusae]